MAVNANASLAGTSNGSGGFNYKITLDDTGTTAINTFWFGWIPGEDFLTQNPTLIGSPAGWTEQIVPVGSGYSIEWTANSSINAIQPAGSSSAFTFSSTETPAQFSAKSTLDSFYPATTSFVYSGAALVSPGQQITPTVQTAAVPAAESASATVAAVEASPGVFNYTVSLTDTGTSTAGTFWFSWVPAEDFMTVRPTAIGAPAGWTDSITGGTPGDGFAIRWIANPGSELPAGATSSAFTFTSTETPQEMAANSPFFPSTPTTTAFTYTGVPFSSTGAQFVAEVQAACFREGTRIRTPRGDAAVEELRPGDHVITAAGQVRPVRWTGRRHVICQGHQHPEQVWPVRVAKAALDVNTPSADLYLSPDHALCLDGVLVPVKYLINGTTIALAPVAAVTWHHLELDSHDVILAEGAPAESYLDTGDRAKFDGEVAELFAGPVLPCRAQMLREAGSDLDFVIAGPILAAIRRRLADRANPFPEAALTEHAA